MMRRELAIVFGARVTWLVATVSALLVGHGFVLALDLYTTASRSTGLVQPELDPLAGIVRPTLGGLYLAAAVLLPVIATRGLAIEKERRSYGALALRAGTTDAVIAVKLVAALAGGALLLVAPIALFVAFALAGGHLDGIETAVALTGHVLNIALVTAASVAAAAATRTVAQATTLAIVVSLTSWAIDASDGFAALAWMGSLEWASIGRKLVAFEQGIVQLGALGWLAAFAAGAGALAIVLGRIDFTPRRAVLAIAIVAVTICLLIGLGRVRRGFDWSEQRRQSLPTAAAAALHELPGPIALDVWLDRDDGRRTELERDALGKLLLARPDLEIRCPLDADPHAVAKPYGTIVLHVGDAVRETRSTSDRELVALVLEAAGRRSPAWEPSSYSGYAFIADGATRTVLVALAYAGLPLALVAIGLFVTRSRRRL